MARDVEGVTVVVEFLCETDEVEPGRIFRPKGESTGSKLAAFNVRGANLIRDDFIEREIEVRGSTKAAGPRWLCGWRVSCRTRCSLRS